MCHCEERSDVAISSLAYLLANLNFKKHTPSPYGYSLYLRGRSFI